MCCLLVGFTGVSYAGVKHVTAQPGEKAKGLQQALNLTDEQTTKIAAIYKESAEKCGRIQKAEHGNSDKMAKAVGPLRAATIKKIEGVLTQNQAAQFDVLVKHTKKSGVDDWGVLCYWILISSHSLH